MSGRKGINLITVFFMIILLANVTAPTSGASYSPPTTTLRIGLSIGTNIIPSANLMNVDNMGSGYEFGYFDNRDFISIGAWTGETRITMLMDRNMIWNPTADEGRGQYQEGSAGDVVVGCFHVQLNAGYNTFEEARAEAANYQGAFVRYQSSQQTPFLVLIGNHTTRAAADNAIVSLGIGSAAQVNAGTSNTITVTRTGTNVILFEFDRGATPFGIMPRASGSEKPETMFKGYRYNGGFQYSRQNGAELSVVNIVNIEDYVKGILPYEMNNAWPIEALKAQALCARTYALSNLNRHSADGADLCVYEHCQVYRGRNAANATTDQAVDETVGLYVTYNGQLAQTFYASTNGGASENVENVWAESVPYLRGVIDPYEADVAPRLSSYYWTIKYTPAQLTERLKLRITGFNLSTIASMKVTRYSATGNAIEVTLTDVNGKSTTLSRRSQILAGLGTPTMRFDIGGAAWGPGSIFVNDPGQPLPPGSDFYGIGADGAPVSVPRDNMYAITGSGSAAPVDGEVTTGGGSSNGMVNGVFVINGAGNGHQVGMSQWGAYSMAFYHNLKYEDIIHFYFTGVEITKTGS